MPCSPFRASRFLLAQSLNVGTCCACEHYAFSAPTTTVSPKLSIHAAMLRTAVHGVEGRLPTCKPGAVNRGVGSEGLFCNFLVLTLKVIGYTVKGSPGSLVIFA